MSNNSIFIPALEGQHVATWRTNRGDASIHPLIGWLLDTTTKYGEPIVQYDGDLLVVDSYQATYTTILTAAELTDFDFEDWRTEHTANFEGEVQYDLDKLRAMDVPSNPLHVARDDLSRQEAGDRLVKEGVAEWLDEGRRNLLLTPERTA